MKWTRESPMNLVSDCKRFRIAKYATKAGDVYALWAVGKVPALHYGDLQSCKEAANEQARPEQ